MDADADPLSFSFDFLFYVAAILPEPTVVLMVVVLVLLLLVSAIISGSEVALFSLDGSAKETLAEAEDRASRRVLALLEKPHSLLITILLLNTLVNVSAAILAAAGLGYLGYAVGEKLLLVSALFVRQYWVATRNAREFADEAKGYTAGP